MNWISNAYGQTKPRDEQEAREIDNICRSLVVAYERTQECGQFYMNGEDGIRTYVKYPIAAIWLWLYHKREKSAVILPLTLDNPTVRFLSVDIGEIELPDHLACDYEVRWAHIESPEKPSGFLPDAQHTPYKCLSTPIDGWLVFTHREGHERLMVPILVGEETKDELLAKYTDAYEFYSFEEVLPEQYRIFGLTTTAEVIRAA